MFFKHFLTWFTLNKIQIWLSRKLNSKRIKIHVHFSALPVLVLLFKCQQKRSPFAATPFPFPYSPIAICNFILAFPFPFSFFFVVRVVAWKMQPQNIELSPFVS